MQMRPNKFNLICGWNVNAKLILSIDEFVGVLRRYDAHHNQGGIERVEMEGARGHDVVTNRHQYYGEWWQSPDTF